MWSCSSFFSPFDFGFKDNMNGEVKKKMRLMWGVDFKFNKDLIKVEL